MSEPPIPQTPTPPVPPPAKPKRQNIFLLIFRGIGAVFRFIRVSIANLLIILLLLLIFVAVSTGDPEPEVAQDSVLVFEPKQSLVEDTSGSDPILDFLMSGTGVGGTKVRDVVRAIRHAASDDRIVALEVRPHRLLGASLVHLNAIGSAIEEFKASGKKVVAYSNFYSQSQYHLASHADKVVMHPYGELVFTGLAFENQYFHTLLNKLHVNVHTFRAGDYKSAVEPYTRDSMSPEVKASYIPILQQLWGGYVETISNNRNLPETQVFDYADGLATLLKGTDKGLAELSREQRLVDELLGPADYSESLASDTQISASGDKPPRIAMDDYLEVIPSSSGTLTVEEPADDATSSTGRIGLVTVSGAILTLPFGQGSDLESTSSAVKHINSAAKANVDALVLRIDSPGGSVFASEQIRMALRELSEKGIPVVASMAGTAASGGYWIAAEADLIMASESTITGSIGVFATFPSVEESLEQVGVNTDGVYSAPNALRPDPLSGVSESDATIIQAIVNTSYDRFLNIVSNGREMSVDDVRAIAGGRIWTGKQALENNLVDKIGGLDQAFEEAAKLAKLKKYRIREYRDRRSSLLRTLLEATGFESPLANSRLGHLIGESQYIVDNVWPKVQFRRVYALCESCTTGLIF
ncbi:MAG: signal peptide peptidase SppA [Gammaproteobacteria bacterium]|nr:signal peptide peptidase SppA [Gammaproteobacteria bacterium]